MLFDRTPSNIVRSSKAFDAPYFLREACLRFILLVIERFLVVSKSILEWRFADTFVDFFPVVRQV